MAGEIYLGLRKMIAGQMIRRVKVFRGYEMEVELNMNIRQYLEGLEAVTVGA